MPSEMPRRLTPAPQVVVGLFIILLGLTLTASNFGWIDTFFLHRLLGYWPIIIVGLGAAKIAGARNPGERVFGGVVAFIGLWLLVGIEQFFPLLLIVLGGVLISRARRAEPGGLVRPDDLGTEFAIWSGIERRVSTREFRGATLTAIMGGIEIDFREAGTASGEAVVDLFVVMGGAELTVPPDWRVVNQVTPFMGGVEDHSTGRAGAQHTLVVRGTVIGGRRGTTIGQL